MNRMKLLIKDNGKYWKYDHDMRGYVLEGVNFFSMDNEPRETKLIDGFNFVSDKALCSERNEK